MAQLSTERLRPGREEVWDDASMVDDELHSWPDVPRLAFGAGPSRRFDAQLTYLGGELAWYGYKEAYRRAALGLFQQVAEDKVRSNLAVFPLAFLWRHSIELGLKDIIAAGRDLAEESPSFPSHHGLLKLWNTARPFIEECGDPNAPELANVEANIVEFEKIDPVATGFRYPLAKDGARPSLPDVPERLNLERLNEAMLAVSNFLDAVHMELSTRLDYRSDQLSAARLLTRLPRLHRAVGSS